MNSIVLYFSVSGNSKRIAEKIAQKAGCGIAQITDDKKWKGLIGFLRGGYYAGTFRTTVPIVEPEMHFTDYDKIVIVGPVWAGNAAPAVYSLLMRERENLEKVCLVLSSGGGETVPAFSRVESKIGSLPQKFGIPKGKADENSITQQVADLLRE